MVAADPVLSYESPRKRSRWAGLVALIVLALVIGTVIAWFFVRLTGVSIAVQVQRPATAANAPALSLVLPSEPAKLTLVQRESKVIPGSNGTLRLSIGDITGGQVLLTISGSDGSTVLDTVSLRARDTVDFKVNGSPFQLHVDEMKNFLVGDDFAVVSIRTAGKPLSEAEKIDRLIQYVESMQGAKFIRNGAEHDPRDAAEHLRRKRQNAGESLKTAKQFVDELASKSSLSGQPYKVRLFDGKEVTSQELLSAELDRIEGKTPEAPTPAKPVKP